ncbi:MAG: DNA internalization-related competence protein ComEC/Rec2 [Gammaproteobacteria bacterium]|nr:DNA internalization-related competence protein ComEC/Rec2 [Gammaproteobacteria bacterium]
MLPALSFFLGVLLLQHSPELPPLPWVLFGLLVGLLAALLLARRLAWLSLLLLGFCYAALHASWHLAEQLPTDWEGRDLLLQGRVLSLPVKFERRLRFEFQPEQVLADGKELAFAGKLRLSWYAKQLPDLRAGERWQLQVRLKRPHGFANPGGFDYQGWLWQQGIRATGYVRTSELNQPLNQPGEGPAGIYFWQRWRQDFAERLEQAASAESLPLLAALTIGERSGFSQEQWQMFRETGANHLVAISGLHVGMVAGLMLLTAGWLWRRSARLCLWLAAPRAAALAALLAAAFYAAMAGFAIPTQRALIMLLVLLLPQLLGRQGRPWQGLGHALILVLLIDPRSVLSPGFILSFAAVAAILWALARRRAGESWLIGLLRMQFAVLLVISPLLILLFNQASLLALPVNLLAVPWFSLVLVPLAFVASLLLLALPSWGAELFALISPLYSLSLEGLAQIAAIGPGLVEMAERPSWLILLACLGGLWLLTPLRLPGRSLGLLLIWPMLAWQRPTLEPGQFEMDFLDVGQGLAVVLSTRNHVLLYDTGAAFSADFNAGSAVVLPFLKQRGIDRLDRLIISHPARDHAGGLAAILAQMPVEQLIAQPGAKAYPRPAEPCRAGLAWEWDGVEFEIVHPREPERWRPNDASCVLRVASGKAKLLLTGDLERPGEQALLAEQGPRLAGSLVQVGHHGSRTSSSPAWVETLAAPLALVSSGYRNPFGFPAAEVVERWRNAGAQVLNTAETGAIHLRFDPHAGASAPQAWRQQRPRYWE